MLKRSAGILLPLFSLPSPYGIGTMGKEARRFADFLHAAGQAYWQMLPLGPTGCGDSPYQSFSSFAGNPYFIDLEALLEDGSLMRTEVEALDWGEDPRHIDYGALYRQRLSLLQKAKERGWARERDEIAAFAAENAAWLDDYALFMALKRRFNMAAWAQWPDAGLRAHQKDALARAREELRADVELFIYVQFLFFRQWAALKRYVNSLGIRIIGDLPIYAAMDSADVWSEAEMFLLGENRVPTEVAGVPPDYFSADGQLWGNPLYDYAAMARDGYSWWIRRVGGAAKLFDVVRIDHFRGFESYWAVPYGAATAKDGQWRKGPGMALVGVLTSWFQGLDFIAEDLGAPSDAVRRLLQNSGLPGMKVLEFAFSPDGKSDYLPHAQGQNCVCYTGTHDNSPLLLWREEAPRDEIAFAVRYLGLNDTEGFSRGMLRGGMMSPAALFVAQMQDYLALGAHSRINTPGTVCGNWQWRLLPGEVDAPLAADIRELTQRYGR